MSAAEVKPTARRGGKRRARAASAPVRPAPPIIPRDSVVGRELVAIVAILTFVAGLTAGALSIVRAAATDWESDLRREVTIQVRAVEGRDTARDVDRVVALARRTSGVADAVPLSREETSRLLQPWLGAGFDLGALPLPQLVVVHLAEHPEPDIAGLRRVLEQELPDATLDDHREWSAKLAALYRGILVAGVAMLGLVLAAITVAVSIATRGAVAANRGVVEVLHLLGAGNAFIANLFQRHFLAAGLRGSVAGGAATACFFLVAGALPPLFAAGAANLLVSSIGVPWPGYAGIVLVAGLVSVATALAARVTVAATLARLD